MTLVDEHDAPPVDQRARNRITDDALGETLFVEAGAGTGKTTALVRRVVALVDQGIELERIAAITFTEAAASELRDRIRQTLERRLRQPRLDDAERDRLQEALDQSDSAAISTLHAFCLRILNEHPVEVGLPPRVEVLDEVASQLAFERRWTTFVDGLYDDEGHADLLSWAFALDVPIEPKYDKGASFKDVAAIFNGNWDRLGDGTSATALPAPDVTELANALRHLEDVRATCVDDTDNLAMAIDVVLADGTALLQTDDVLTWLRSLSITERWKNLHLGKAGSWRDKAAAKDAATRVKEIVVGLRDAATDEVARQLGDLLATFTLSAAQERRREGRLEYHDLLVLARQLVHDHPEARAALHERYQRLLLDEFQDTDPIQIEVAALIAATDDPTIGQRWDDVAHEPGRLFFVGDPKQSIYRFRRADIALFLQASQAYAADGAERLVQNFRSVPTVLAWVNHLFGSLIGDGDGVAQPEYVPLVAARSAGEGDHRVVVLGGPSELKADPLRQAEAADVVSAIAAIRDDPDMWMIWDDLAKAWRRPRMADITILLPTRTSLHTLEDRLEDEGIPYRIDTGTLVYDTQEVRELLAALRAVDDPTDEIAVVTALRSPLYACSDVELFRYRNAGGRWNLPRTISPAAAEAAPAVAAALMHLRSLWEVRWWTTPSALLERLLRERQAFALAFSERRPREVWRRLRFVLDQARLFGESGGGDLRSFISWAELQRREGSRVHEPALPESDEDAVRIMTIHGAKGLEFPITIVSGATTQLGRRRKGVDVEWDDDGRYELKVNSNTSTSNFDRLATFEEEMDKHERLRLLYVACTRAKDHLIVSAHHKIGAESYGSLIHQHGPPIDEELARALPSVIRPPRPLELHLPDAPPADARAEWIVRRESALAAARRVKVRSATAVAMLAADVSADADVFDDAVESPQASESGGGDGQLFWRRGRAGSAIGRAVHAVLQHVDFADPRGLESLAAREASLEAVDDVVDQIERMVRSVLSSESVALAVKNRHWRELFVAAPVGDTVIEGYVDLLVETSDGLHIVDYKTDTVKGPADVDAKVERYRLQLAAYAVALETSTAKPVVGATLVFASAKGPIERSIDDLDGAKAEVRALLA